MTARKYPQIVFPCFEDSVAAGVVSVPAVCPIAALRGTVSACSDGCRHNAGQVVVDAFPRHGELRFCAYPYQVVSWDCPFIVELVP